MKYTDPLKDLELISQKIGENRAYVQGGGGNTSVKLDDNRMAIKASGWLLSDVTTVDGYSVVDYQKIREYLDCPDQDEDTFTKKIKSFVVETNNRPSIETGFHALVSRCVVHTHSVYANLLACSKEGASIAKGLFPDSAWVGYAAPGRKLTLEVKDVIRKRNEIPSIVFLENHGVIVSSDDAKSALEIHGDINKKIKMYFELPEEDFDPADVEDDLDLLKQYVLFPDQVVYTLSGEDILNTTAARETLAAYRYILRTIKEKGLSLNILSKEDADYLLNMESEKYRQGMLKK